MSFEPCTECDSPDGCASQDSCFDPRGLNRTSFIQEAIGDKYRKLLMKYIEHVNDCEGTTFIRDAEKDMGFSRGEVAELKKLENLIFNHNQEGATQ